MKVTYANQVYHCTKAVRSGDNATLYLTDGSIVEFVCVHETTWEMFQFEDGDWIVTVPMPSNTARLDALESALLVLIGGIENV